MKWQETEGSGLGELDWSVESRAESLSTVFEHTVGHTLKVEEWYAEKRRAKRPWARTLRIGAIVLGAIAAALPILSEISANDGGTTIAPGWAAVALVGAATLVALDRYFGFSAAWMRFMATELRLAQLRHDFEYAWESQRATLGSQISDGELLALLDLAGGLSKVTDKAVAEETGAWVSEFQTSLERAEQSLQRTDER